jgi:hypothetical protein
LAPILWNNFTGKKGYRNLKGNIQIVKNLSRKYEAFAGALSGAGETGKTHVEKHGETHAQAWELSAIDNGMRRISGASYAHTSDS